MPQKGCLGLVLWLQMSRSWAYLHPNGTDKTWWKNSKDVRKGCEEPCPWHPSSPLTTGRVQPCCASLCASLTWTSTENLTMDLPVTE